MSKSPFHDIPLLSDEFLGRMLRQVQTVGSQTTTVEALVEKPKEQKRCPICRHKLQLADIMCRCGLRHCSSHRLPETHACTFDHKGHDQALLKTQVVACVSDKVKERL